jgi:STE24 endopeptidase
VVSDIYPVIIIIGIISEVLVKLYTTHLNKKHLSKVINNKEFDEKLFDESFLKKTYTYLSDKIPVSFISEVFSVFFILYLVFSGNLVQLSLFFNSIFPDSEIIAHLLLLGTIGVIFYLFSLPLNIYDTFFIEKKHGFSTITIKTFIFDNIKIIIISIIIGGLLLSIIFWLVLKIESNWWIFAWITSILFSLLIMKIFPTLIAPLFNKFTPLEDGELKNKIMNYAKEANFKLKNILRSDASKRSKHSNAYFTGFGKNKQIVLYDTLIEQLTADELSSVILHEIGHYKKKHIWIMFLIQTIFSGLILFLVEIFTSLESFISAFNLNEVNYLTTFIFSILFVQSFTWFIGLPAIYLSRINEFAADKFSVNIIKNSEYLISSLLKLTKENLSNPYPHPFYSTLYYSHPPITERVRELRIEN